MLKLKEKVVFIIQLVKTKRMTMSVDISFVVVQRRCAGSLSKLDSYITSLKVWHSLSHWPWNMLFIKSLTGHSLWQCYASTPKEESWYTYLYLIGEVKLFAYKCWHVSMEIIRWLTFVGICLCTWDKDVSYAYKDCIYVIKDTVRLWNIIRF